MLRNHVQQGVARRNPRAHHQFEVILLSRHRLLHILLGELEIQGLDDRLVHILLFAHDRVKHDLDRAQHKLFEAAHHLAGRVLLDPLLFRRGVVVFAPQLRHHLGHGQAELGRVHLCKVAQSEAPRVQSRAKANLALLRQHLHAAQLLIPVRLTNHVHALNRVSKVLVALVQSGRQLQKNAIQFVEEQDWADALRNGLSQHSLSLDAHAFDTIDHHQRTIRHTQRRRHFAGKINVSWRINQVDQIWLFVRFLLVLVFEFRTLIIQRHRRGFDGNGTRLLVVSRVHEAGLALARISYDPRLANKRIGQRRLAVVHMRNHRDVANVILAIHHAADLVYREIHHGALLVVPFLAEPTIDQKRTMMKGKKCAQY
mmetsp:Transcript_45157/g.74867  ORF Transcript_45157/g.74867 Transcript_45157/m.74867 type:complete len:370 (+) Transcript_45157:1785-2894(+)